MNKRELFEVGLRLLGILWIADAVAGVPGTLSYFFSIGTAQAPVTTPVAKFLVIIYPLGAAILGILFAFRGDRVAGFFMSNAGNSEIDPSSSVLPALWTKLLGIYLCVITLGDFIDNVNHISWLLTENKQHPFSNPTLAQAAISLVSYLFSLGAGLVLIIKGDAIAAYISKPSTDTGDV